MATSSSEAPKDITPLNPIGAKIFMSGSEIAGYTRQLNYRIVYFVSKSEFKRLLDKLNANRKDEPYLYTDFMPNGEYDLYYNYLTDTPIAYYRSNLDVITLDNYEYMWIVHPWESSNTMVGAIYYGWPNWIMR